MLGADNQQERPESMKGSFLKLFLWRVFIILLGTVLLFLGVLLILVLAQILEFIRNPSID